MRKTPLKHRYLLSWRYLFEKKARVSLTLVGVAIGVATIFAVAIANQTTVRSFAEMIDDVTGRADLEVISSTDDGLPISLAEELASQPGVASVVPLISKQVMLLRGDDRQLVLMLGVDPLKDQEVHRYRLAQGRMVAFGQEAALVSGSAAAGKTVLGEQVTFLTPGGPLSLPLVGLLEKEGPARYGDGAVAFVPLALAQRLFAMDSRVTTLQLVLRDAAAAEATKEKLRSVVPPSAVVQFPATRGKSAAQWVGSTTSGLSYASYLAILLGGFIIFNTFSMTVAERRRDLSILRALGTSRRQVMALILVESSLVGILGTLAGLGVGLLLARFFIAVLAGFAGTSVRAFSVPPWGIVTSLVAGIGISVLATFLPARRATAVSPLEGLRPAVSHGDRASASWAIAGLPVAALGLILFVLYLASDATPADVGMLGIIVFLLGCTCVLPAVYRLLIAGTGAALRRPLGVSALLAERNLLRTETRNALTIAVLMLAVTVVTGIGAAVQSGMDAVARWQSSTLSADFFVRGSIVDPGGTTSVQIGEGLEATLLRMPGVASVDKLRFLKAEGPDGEMIVLAKSFSDRASLRLTMDTGEEEAVRAGLERGEVVVSTTLARRYNLRLGDTFSLKTKSGTRAFRVAGINEEYTNGGNALYMEWLTAQRELGAAGVDAFYVQAARGSDLQALEASLSGFAKDQGLILQSARELHEYVDRMVGGAMSFYWAIGLIGMAVASLGIVSTLTTNVLDRWREIAMLRAIAATRRQIRRLILTEALYLGFISAIAGAVLGTLLAFIFVQYQSRVNGYNLDFTWQWPLVLGVALASIVIALLASLFPARRATKVNVVAAIKQE